MEVNTTENKTLEQDYRDLAGLLSNIVDSLPIYFFVKDTGDNFRYVYSSPLMNNFTDDIIMMWSGKQILTYF
mgnify:FL=1